MGQFDKKHTRTLLEQYAVKKAIIRDTKYETIKKDFQKDIKEIQKVLMKRGISSTQIKGKAYDAAMKRQSKDAQRLGYKRGSRSYKYYMSLGRKRLKADLGIKKK